MTTLALEVGSHKPTTGAIRTVTKNVSVHPVVRPPAKIKLLRSNPHRFTAIRINHSDPWDEPDDEDLAVSRNRRLWEGKFKFDDNEDVSPYVARRLAAARDRALAAYRAKYTELASVS